MPSNDVPAKELAGFLVTVFPRITTYRTVLGSMEDANVIQLFETSWNFQLSQALSG